MIEATQAEFAALARIRTAAPEHRDAAIVREMRLAASISAETVREQCASIARNFVDPYTVTGPGDPSLVAIGTAQGIADAIRS